MHTRAMAGRWAVGVVGAAMLLGGAQLAHAAAFIDRNGDANNEGNELANPGVFFKILDEIPGGPVTTVFWRIGGAGLDLFDDPNNPGTPFKSSAAPAGAHDAIASALASIAASSNFLFIESTTTAARWNNLPDAGVNGNGNTLDFFFADLDTAFGAGTLGGASTGNAVGVQNGTTLAANDTFIASNVDLVFNDKLGVFNPNNAPAGYAPVKNPLTNPYGTFTSTGNGAVLDDIESTAIHEASHALGLQHPDRAVQNINTDARFTRNYDTTNDMGTIKASMSFVINEDNFFTSGLVRMRDGSSNAVAGEPFSVTTNGGSSAYMNSVAATTGGIIRTATPDDLKGLAYLYQDAVAQSAADTLQAATAARYASVIIESDYSKVGGTTNTWNDDPSQTTRNDLRANAQFLGDLDLSGGSFTILGSIAGRATGAESPGGDVDNYLFMALGGDHIRFDLDEGVDVGNSVDTLLRLYKDDGTLLASFDTDQILDAQTKSGSLSDEDPAFDFIVPGNLLQQFSFYIRVEGVLLTPVGGGATFNSEGDYVLNITVIPEPTTFAFVAVALGAVMLLGRRVH
ncbi:MAG: hypothetical protein GC162_14275 [Planctomycetes bacterium]|nr:hypothetical protein [Planctomycetota bacterium]